MYKTDPLSDLSADEKLAIADRISYLRKEIFHMKQSQFSKLIDISQTYLSLIENHRKPIFYDTVLKIATTNDVNIEWLLYGRDSDKIFNSNNINEQYIKSSHKENALEELKCAYSLNEREITFVDWFSSLSSKERLSFLDAVESLQNLFK
ncbi:MAG: helix-turn-helix transcriptional regulator [Butyrivibrio sp.]|nr:helix-turn-helix transcriptional regulator [Butyrivibrio sp.]